MNQLVLPFIDGDQYHIDEFIISASNKLAYDCINNAQIDFGHQPYPFALLLHGPASSGKTYITKIWQRLTNAHLINQNHFAHWNILSKHQSFIIEDIENNWNEEHILSYFNLMHEHQRSLLITSKFLIDNFKLQDLSSRIRSIRKLEIYPPDDLLIKTFLFKQFATNSIKISIETINFLLPRLPRQFDQIIDIISKINQFALSNKCNINIKLIKRALNQSHY